MDLLQFSVYLYIYNVLLREIIMTTNLTIKLDSNLLEKINWYARKSGKTVVELVKDQLEEDIANSGRRKE